MTLFIVAPTEPPTIKTLIGSDGVVSMLPEHHGCDVVWYVRGVMWGVQRKELKDFIQSVGDGRLAKEIAQMKASGIPMPMVLIEGKVQWNNDDTLKWNSRGQTFTKAQWRGILWSIRSEGIHIDFTSSMLDTVEYIQTLARWSEKDKHQSIMRRPTPGNYWGKATNEDYAVHLLQGFDGVGIDRAKAIVRHFGGVPLDWTVTEKELMQVPGLGKVLAQRLLAALVRTQPEEMSNGTE